MFGFAGRATQDAVGQWTVAILTTDANEVARPIHSRMPLMFESDDAASAWIDPEADEDTLADLLQGPPSP